MKVILLADVRGTGRKYDVKEVADGYAMNFLLPRKLAEQATPAREKEIEQLKRDQEATAAVQADLLAKNLKALSGATITISAKASEKGSLFKGVGIPEILEALQAQAHIALPPEAVKLAEPIKEVGQSEVPVELNGEQSQFTLVVSAEQEA